MKMRFLVLLLVNIFCLAKFVKSYGVTEHRVDYIKTADGHEYDYHYHDGSAPRFEKTKFHHLQPQQQQQFQQTHPFNLHQQPLRSKRPYKQPFKQPYFNKYFSTGVHEQTYSNNEFQAAPSSYSNSGFKQQNSIPIFESHEKVRQSFIDNDNDDEDNKNNNNRDYDEEPPTKSRPAILTSTLTQTNPIFGSTSSLQRLQPTNGHRSNKYNSYESSSELDETPSRPSTGSSSHSGPPFHFLANASSPVNIPGFHLIAGGYSYFSTHPSSSKLKPQPALFEKPYSEEVITTTTRRPYVAPTLTTSTPAPKLYIHPRPTKAHHQRRPYIAPALTTTKRPYVAPSVLQATGKVTDPSFLALGQQPAVVNGASRFRYTQPNSKTPSTTTKSNTKKSEKQSELYEPEFDIDIRIDLSSDSGH